MESQLPSLVDYRLIEKETEWGMRWMDTITDSVSSFSKWWGGKKTVPQVEMQTFSGQINEIPEVQQPLLGGHEEVENAPWGEDSDLPGGPAEFEFEGVLESPPLEFGSEAYIHQLQEREMALRDLMGKDMGDIQMVDLSTTIEDSAELLETAEIVGEAVEATTAGILGGAALGVLGAAALIGLTIG